MATARPSFEQLHRERKLRLLGRRPVYNFYGTAKLTNCTVSGNSAGYGGGVYNQGKATLNYCTVSNNSASISGGGVFNERGQGHTE